MWAVFAIASALFWATSDAAAKRLLERGMDPARLVFVRHAVSVPLLLPLLARGVPRLDAPFWWLHLAWVPLETAAIYLYIHAIRISPLSLTLPFLALTPLLIVVSGAGVLGQRVGPAGLAGIVLVAVGSYVIHVDRLRYGWFGPLKAIVRERGTRWMLVVAAIYSVTSVLGRLLVEHSSATYFAAHYALVMVIVLAPAGLRPAARRRWPGRAAWPALVATGVFFGLMILCHMLAIERGIVAYAIALKRLSGVFAVGYGALLFGERRIAQRLAGSTLMALGAGLIVIAAD